MVFSCISHHLLGFRGLKMLTVLLLTAVGLGSYIETLLRKSNTEFNVRSYVVLVTYCMPKK